MQCIVDWLEIQLAFKYLKLICSRRNVNNENSESTTELKQWLLFGLNQNTFSAYESLGILDLITKTVSLKIY